MRFYGASTSEVTDDRNEWYFMIMMANDIQGWMGPEFSWHLSYSWENTRKKFKQVNWLDRRSNPDPSSERQRTLPPRPQRWSKIDRNLIAKYRIVRGRQGSYPLPPTTTIWREMSWTIQSVTGLKWAFLSSNHTTSQVLVVAFNDIVSITSPISNVDI